jgi:DNA polymerase III subunit epsilon
MREPIPPQSISESEFDALEGMARALTASGLYRVIRRFRPRRRYAEEDGAPKKHALFIDLETTGLDHGADAIIEFCGVPFEYGPADGRIYGVGEPVVYLEDPGRPIPEEVVALTGITNDMVRGQRIDDARVHAMLDGVNLVVAHNATFDRRFLERRLRVFERTPWACAIAEVPWHRYGCHGTKLEFILFKRCAEFFDGHRAAEDCYAGIHVLATAMPCGTVPFKLLLDSARTATVRVWAHESPYASKDALKARKYRWHGGEDGRPRAWYIDVHPTKADEECVWLTENVYRDRPLAWQKEPVTALSRYSGRM